MAYELDGETLTGEELARRKVTAQEALEAAEEALQEAHEVLAHLDTARSV